MARTGTLNGLPRSSGPLPISRCAASTRSVIPRVASITSRLAARRSSPCLRAVIDLDADPAGELVHGVAEPFQAFRGIGFDKRRQHLRRFGFPSPLGEQDGAAPFAHRREPWEPLASLELSQQGVFAVEPREKRERPLLEQRRHLLRDERAAHLGIEAPPERVSLWRETADSSGHDRLRAGYVLRKWSIRKGLVERYRGREKIDREARLFRLLQLAGLELDYATDAVLEGDEVPRRLLVTARGEQRPDRGQDLIEDFGGRAHRGHCGTTFTCVAAVSSFRSCGAAQKHAPLPLAERFGSLDARRLRCRAAGAPFPSAVARRRGAAPRVGSARDPGAPPPAPPCGESVSRSRAAGPPRPGKQSSTRGRSPRRAPSCRRDARSPRARGVDRN